MSASVARPRPILIFAAVAVALMATAAPTSAQPPDDVHPAKVVFTDYSEWPATAPGSIRLSRFAPFRAVYERHYVDGSGLDRQDRVIVSAEYVAWGERTAIVVGLTDTGNLDYDDTTARQQTRFFAEDDLSLLLQVTPTTGTAKDYTLWRVEGDTVFSTRVGTATGESQHASLGLPTAGWGAPGVWVVGSMELTEGLRIRLAPYVAQGSSNVLGTSSYHVVGREQVTVPDLGRVDAWAVEYPLGMNTGRMMKLLITDRPPYLLGKVPYDVDTGETTVRSSLTLLEFHEFPAGR